MKHRNRNNSSHSSQENNHTQDKNNQTEDNKDHQELQKLNVNPNPRANENVKNTAFEKETKETGVGSEITDGEAG